MAHSETFPDLPPTHLDGSDFNDLENAHGPAAVVEAINTAVAQSSNAAPVVPTVETPPDWPELVPLQDDPATDRPGPFPFHGLGVLLGCAAYAIARDVQAPDAMAAGSVLAAASLVVQPLADVVMPHGQRAPLSEFFVTSGRSGDRKSAVDDVACAEINRRRKEQAREYHRAHEQYKRERAQVKRNEEEPVEPMPQAITTGNATVEGVSRLLRGQSFIGIFSPEGGEMLGGHSMKEQQRMASMAFFLKGWSGESLDSMRGGNGFTSLLGRRMALHIMVQPLLLGQLLADPLAAGQGFLARCLISQPDTLAGTRMFNGADPKADPDVVAYNERVAMLLDMRPTLWPEGDGFELKPRTLEFSEEARALWIEFYNEVERQQAPGGELENAYTFASKATEHLARVAGIIAMFNNPDTDLIDAETMVGAMEVINFYLKEHVRLTGASRKKRKDADLRRLVDWLQGLDALPTVRHIVRNIPYRELRRLKTDGILAMLNELQQRGYVRPVGDAWEVRQDA